MNIKSIIISIGAFISPSLITIVRKCVNNKRINKGGNTSSYEKMPIFLRNRGIGTKIS